MQDYSYISLSYKVVPGGNRYNDTHVGTYVCTHERTDVGTYVFIVISIAHLRYHVYYRTAADVGTQTTIQNITSLPHMM